MTSTEIPAGIRKAIEAQYEPLELLRGGGMATVIRARERALGRDVVIKVLPSLATSDEARERFRQEILLVAALQHPQIVPVLTALVVDGAPAYVMPFVSGESLYERIRRGPLSVREAVAILLDVARALEHAHAHGVIHRDIKPGNVLLTASSAVVTDFGIAKVRAIRGRGPLTPEREGGAPAAITREGISLGTAAYMAPEQVVGDPNADHRVDLYALGMVAYEMLAGALPFAATASHQLLAAQLIERPAPLSKRRADIPPGLEALVMRCLEKDRAARPADAGAVVRILQDPDALARRPEASARTARGLSAAGAGGESAWSRMRDAASKYVRGDVVAALRSLRRAPAVTAVCVASLALGIGANAAIFSMFDQILLRPLPVPEPDKVVMIDAMGPNWGSQSCGTPGNCAVVLSYPMVRDLEKKETGLAGFAAFVGFRASIASDIEPIADDGLYVSGGYFGALQLQPTIGRLIAPADDEVIGGHPVAVLSWEFWRERYGARTDILDGTIRVNGEPLRIIGVAPRGFTSTALGLKPAIYVPLSHVGVLQPTQRVRLDQRNFYFLYGVGRLANGTTVEGTQARLNAVYQPINQEVDAPLQTQMPDSVLTRFRAKTLTVRLAPSGSSGLKVSSRAPLIALLAVAGLVLLTACANIMNILLARGASRSAEMGLRLALGARRSHLVRLLLTESVVLAVIGGLVSVVVAEFTLRSIGTMLPPWGRDLNLSVDGELMMFALFVGVGCGILCGLVPALQATRQDLMGVIRSGSAQHSGSRHSAKLRSALVTMQLALSVALLIGAGLFLSSLRNVTRVDLGVAVEGRSQFTIAPGRAGYDSLRTQVVFAQIEDAMRQLPGVIAVGTARNSIITGNSSGGDITLEGFTPAPGQSVNVRQNWLGPDFFKTLEIPLLEGRDFTADDRLGTRLVAVVNKTFVDIYSPDVSPVGRRMSIGGGRATEFPIEIVGVVANARLVNIKQEFVANVYLPWRQAGQTTGITYYVHSSASPEAMLQPIRETMRRIDPALPVENLRTLPETLGQNIYFDRLIGFLTTTFALIATLLAGVGLYGSISYSVAQRTRELGIRVALGAEPRRIVRLVLGQVGVMAAVGLTLGVVAALGAQRWLTSILFELSASDPRIVVASVVLLGLVALLAAFVPARRAARADPLLAMRSE